MSCRPPNDLRRPPEVIGHYAYGYLLLVWQKYAIDGPALRKPARSIATYRIESTHLTQAGGQGHLTLSQDRRSEGGLLRGALPVSQLDSWSDHNRVAWRRLGASGDQLLQFGVFGLGLLKDGDVGVGVFPEREEAPTMAEMRSLGSILFSAWLPSSLAPPSPIVSLVRFRNAQREGPPKR